MKAAFIIRFTLLLQPSYPTIKTMSDVCDTMPYGIFLIYSRLETVAIENSVEPW